VLEGVREAWGMFAVVKGAAETVIGEPVIAVYLRGSGGNVVGAGGIVVRLISTAVRPVDQVPKTLLRVRLNGDVVEMAVIVPEGLNCPSARIVPLTSIA
jgi:hypothetical protein